MNVVLDWLVAYLLRWLPRSAPTGLFRISNPDERSPVIVTANFALTVRRVRTALRGQNLWLLVANSDGINVWCAAAGGIFNHNRIIDAVKVSGLADKVRHRQLILPALSAAGVDLSAVRAETGFSSRFGPVYATDIPAYLGARKKKTEAMKRFEFGLRHRLDMFVSMNFPIYLLPGIAVAIFCPQYLAGYTILFWSDVAFLYVFLDILPGKTGWSQAAWSATFLAAVWMGVDWIIHSDPLVHWGWLLASYGIFFAAGFDTAGVAAARRSDPERMMQQLGFKSFGTFFNEKQLGHIRLDRELCNGCNVCADLCPVGVYDALDHEKKVTFRDRDACFACNACTQQCSEDALSLFSAAA